MTPFQKLKSLKPEIKKQILLFPPYLLDKLVPIYLFLAFAHKINALKSPPKNLLPRNNVLADYKNGDFIYFWLGGFGVSERSEQ